MALVTDTYKYKKGRVIQATRKNSGDYLLKYSYDKKGRLSKVTQFFAITAKKTAKYTTSYIYDTKGNVVKEKQTGTGSPNINRYKNVYENGALVEHTLKNWPDFNEKIAYKTISVLKKYASKVKAQQKRIFICYGKDQDPLFF